MNDVRPVRGIGIAAAVLIALAALANVVAYWSDRTDLGVAATVVLVVAAMVFMMWLWQARANAEILSDAPHRRSRVWLTLGWLVPILNLWFPYQIVADIHRASRPRGSAAHGSRLLPVWWTLWVLNNVAASVVVLTPDLSDGTARLLGLVAIATMACAAVPIIVIMREISAWQAPK